ncbi:transcriptional regulator, LysR family [Methylobacterium pseudosasicola]|uniref:Transcriptional regulator, LysR family n=2 Tax=Methylobacterium pseudosasicola TaxID=582667 RepID=A0A1I4S7Y2_9HYPH|nr:transcriptional regulator, LysR family [Methylobacterium pseudosasicola]
MNPAHLDLFRAVLRHGGMTKAAAVLGIGQPHISRAIAQLETDLGFELFVRGHGSASPTLEGEAFAREVERTYAGLEHLRDTARQIREVGTGRLRIACQPSLATRLLPRAIRRLNAAHPEARVAVHMPGPDTIWSWAASGQCEIGLVRRRSGYAGVACETFLSVDAICALPRHHALTRKAVVTIQDLAGESLVAGTPGALQEALDGLLAQAGVAPRVSFVAQYTAARCGLVAEGLGLAIVDPVPARALKGLPIVLRPFQPRLPIETVLIRPAGRPPDQMAGRLIALLHTERDALIADLPIDRR